MSLMQWPGRRRKASKSGWLKHIPDNELEVLIALADLDSLPPEAQRLYADIQTRAETSMKATLALPSPDNATVPPDTSFADVLRIRWRSADSSIRHTLRTVANALGVSVPLTRTKKSSVGGKDSSGSQRTESVQHPNRDDSEPLERAAEAEEPDYHDPPEWHDELADGWTHCESLHEAFRSDSEWY